MSCFLCLLFEAILSSASLNNCLNPKFMPCRAMIILLTSPPSSIEFSARKLLNTNFRKVLHCFANERTSILPIAIFKLAPQLYCVFLLVVFQSNDRRPIDGFCLKSVQASRNGGMQTRLVVWWKTPVVSMQPGRPSTHTTGWLLKSAVRFRSTAWSTRRPSTTAVRTMADAFQDWAS